MNPPTPSDPGNPKLETRNSKLLSPWSGLRLLLGVSSSIAAYRALDIASTIVKGGGAVRAVLTPDTEHLVGRAAFDAITGNRTVVNLWGSGDEGSMDHLAATKWANVFAVAPCTAATLAKLALGLADDALSTFHIAWPGPLVVAPAMNPTMFLHPTVQEHLATLRARGAIIVDPDHGPTACGDEGRGRLAPVDHILEAIRSAADAINQPLDLSGERILITSGPTREFIDPVRCITNPSSGKMGIALARVAQLSGARVTLVTGPTSQPIPPGIDVERITTAEQMKEAVLRRLPEATVVIFAAAVSDWRPVSFSPRKEKKESAASSQTMSLERTPDIALSAREAKHPGQVFIGFAAESNDLLAYARAKMQRKGFAFVVANNIAESGAGFESDTNHAWIVTPSGDRELPPMTKVALAREVLREYLSLK